MIATEILEEQTTIEWLPISEILVDVTYQRPLSPNKVRQIVSNYNKNAIGTLQVSQRGDGQFYVMDGQHRHAAMKKLGIIHAECRVIHGLSLAQEADIFIKCNANTKTPEAIDLFRARLIRQEPIVIAIMNVVEKCGLFIQFRPEGGGTGGTHKRPPTAIWAVNALETIYTRGKEALLEELLTLAKLCWPDNGDAFQSKVILGIADFYMKYRGRYLRQDFITKMNGKELKSLLRRAQYHSENGGGAFPKTFSKALQEEYDKGRRNRRLEDK